VATASSSDPTAVAAVVLELAGARPPTLGAGRLVCIDGPAGSGKTTLAGALAEPTGAQVVHMDDLMAGWDGATDTAAQLDSIVRPLLLGRPGSYRHFDWGRDRFAGTVAVPPGPWLVIEGVGSGSPAVSAGTTVLVWVEADDDLRLARGMTRDGWAMEDRWRQFMADESAMFARDRTRDRADVLVDGTGRTPPVVRAHARLST
jgi:hypothetical protein